MERDIKGLCPSILYMVNREGRTELSVFSSRENVIILRCLSTCFALPFLPRKVYRWQWCNKNIHWHSYITGVQSLYTVLGTDSTSPDVPFLLEGVLPMRGRGLRDHRNNWMEGIHCNPGLDLPSLREWPFPLEVLTHGSSTSTGYLAVHVWNVSPVRRFFSRPQEQMSRSCLHGLLGLFSCLGFYTSEGGGGEGLKELASSALWVLEEHASYGGCAAVQDSCSLYLESQCLHMLTSCSIPWMPG